MKTFKVFYVESFNPQAAIAGSFIVQAQDALAAELKAGRKIVRDFMDGKAPKRWIRRTCTFEI